MASPIKIIVEFYFRVIMVSYVKILKVLFALKTGIYPLERNQVEAT